MITLIELENLIQQLPRHDVWQLSNWLQNYVNHLPPQPGQNDLTAIKELFEQAKNQVINPAIDIDALINEMME